MLFPLPSPDMAMEHRPVMRIVISALHYEWKDMPSCLERAEKTFGLDGVELSWHTSGQRPHCTEADLAWLRDARGHHGLHLSAHIWDNPARAGTEAFRRICRHWFDICETTGVTGLVLHGGTWPDRREGVSRVVEALRAVADDAAKAGVTLYLENHYAFDYRDSHELFSESWEFLALLREGPDNLAFCFDTGHGHMTRTWEELLPDLAPWLRYVHLADNHGVHDDHCAYGEGTVPWKPMLTRLRDLGFDGTFCVEFPVRDDLAPFRRCVADVRRMFA